MTTRDSEEGSAPEPLVRSFSTLEAASEARDALVAGGLPADLVRITVLEDEAGPVSGNFVIGNGRTARGGRPGPLRTGDEVPYDENFRDPAYGSVYLLTLAGLSPIQRCMAESILARFDAVPVTEVAAAAAGRR